MSIEINRLKYIKLRLCFFGLAVVYVDLKQ